MPPYSVNVPLPGCNFRSVPVFSTTQRVAPETHPCLPTQSPAHRKCPANIGGAQQTCAPAWGLLAHDNLSSYLWLSYCLSPLACLEADTGWDPRRCAGSLGPIARPLISGHLQRQKTRSSAAVAAGRESFWCCLRPERGSLSPGAPCNPCSVHPQGCQTLPRLLEITATQ